MLYSQNTISCTNLELVFFIPQTELSLLVHGSLKFIPLFFKLLIFAGDFMRIHLVEIIHTIRITEVRFLRAYPSVILF
jgi:hypothetical protein